MTRVDFFVSYTTSDRAWAEWVAWQLKEAGYSVTLQAWDFRPGMDFLHAGRATVVPGSGSSDRLRPLDRDWSVPTGFIPIWLEPWRLD